MIRIPDIQTIIRNPWWKLNFEKFWDLDPSRPKSKVLLTIPKYVKFRRNCSFAAHRLAKFSMSKFAMFRMRMWCRPHSAEARSFSSRRPASAKLDPALFCSPDKWSRSGCTFRMQLQFAKIFAHNRLLQAEVTQSEWPDFLYLFWHMRSCTHSICDVHTVWG